MVPLYNHRSPTKSTMTVYVVGNCRNGWFSYCTGALGERFDEKLAELLPQLIDGDVSLERKPLHGPIQCSEDGPCGCLHVAFSKDTLLDAAFDHGPVRLFVAISFFDYLSKQGSG